MNKSALAMHVARDTGGLTWSAMAPADLAPLISGYVGRQSTTHCERFCIFPNARIELFFNFGSPYFTNPRVDQPLGRLHGATVFAPKLERNDHQCGPIVDWFLVQLTLTGCTSVLGQSASDLLQVDRPLADLIGDEAPALHQQLGQQRSFEHRAASFSAWARRRSRAKPSLTRLSSLCELARAQGVHSVRDAAERCGIGERRLRDCFLAEVGIPPKKWLSIMRAERLWATLHPQARYRLATFAEFADESHAHREFKRWTGMTIGEYQSIKRAGDGLVNGGIRHIVPAEGNQSSVPLSF